MVLELRIGVLWRGNAADGPPDPELTRLREIFRALAERGAEGVAVVFADDAAERVREELLALDGVLVWVDPIMDGVNRAVLDGVLRDVAARGVYVSAHPDVILAMGTKDVLFRTRAMGWGTDVRRYVSPTELLTNLPGALSAGPRVLKQLRGNGGNGVWRVESAGATDGAVRVLHGLRGSAVATMSLAELASLLTPYFAGGAHMIDQAFQAQLSDGMVRCYMAQDRVAGFGHQMVTALLAPNEDGAAPPAPPPRLYYGPTEPRFQDVRAAMESEWLPDLLRTLELEARQLPAIWDADLLYGAPASGDRRRYVLCEINVSSVLPIPDESVAPLADVAVRCSAEAKASRTR